MSLKEILDEGVHIEVWKDEFHCLTFSSVNYFIKFTKTIEEDEYILLQRFSDTDFEYIDFIIDSMYHKLIYKIENERCYRYG